MRKSKQEVAETRRRIVTFAAREFNKSGINRTGIAHVMTAAGLTTGGFYKHCSSKDQLVAEALGAALQKSVDSVEAKRGGDLNRLPQATSPNGTEIYGGGLGVSKEWVSAITSVPVAFESGLCGTAAFLKERVLRQSQTGPSNIQNILKAGAGGDHLQRAMEVSLKCERVRYG